MGSESRTRKDPCVKFAEFVCREAVRAELLAVDQQGVIGEMAQALLDAGQIAEDDYKSIVNAILNREELAGQPGFRGGQ